MVVKTDLQTVTRSVTASTSSAPSPRGCRAKTVVDADVQVVAIVGGGGHEVEVLKCARQVRHRNIRQQSLRYRVDLRNLVARESGVGQGIENLYRLPAHGSRIADGLGLGKASVSLQQRRHRRKLIERIFSVLAVEVDEVKRLGPAVVDVGNVQRSAYGAAEAILYICGLLRGLAGERKRRGIQRRIADAVIQRSMRAIDVETPPAETASAIVFTDTATT